MCRVVEVLDIRAVDAEDMPHPMCREAVDDMVDVAAGQLAGTVVTYTVDRLAFSPSPPMVQAVIDIDGGDGAPWRWPTPDRRS